MFSIFIHVPTYKIASSKLLSGYTTYVFKEFSSRKYRSFSATSYYTLGTFVPT